MSRPRKFNLSAAEIKRLYVVEGRSQSDIAEAYGVSQALVYLRMLEFGIKAKPDRMYRSQLNRDALKDLYIDKAWSIKKISDHFKCKKSTVQGNLKKYGLMGLTEEEHARRTAASNKSRTRASINDSQGYILTRDLNHPSAVNGYVIEHRMVVEKVLGRVLTDDEQVHHINLRKRDNWIENLAVLNRNDHKAIHWHMERALAFVCGLSDIRPKPMDFGEPVFWGGKWITSIDFVAMADERRGIHSVDPVRALARSIRENGLKYEFEEAS